MEGSSVLGDAGRFSRLFGGVGLLLAAVSFGGADVLRLSIEGGKEGVEQLVAIERNAGLWQVASLLNLAGVVLFVPAVLALVHLTRGRSPRLAHLGGAFALVGLLGWAAHWRGYFGLMGAGATTDAVEHGAFVRFVEDVTATPDTVLYVLMFALVSPLGFLFLAAALLRARTAPRWASRAFALGWALLFVGTFTPLAEEAVAAAFVWIVIAAGLAGVGLSVLRAGDERWELRGLPAKQAEAA